MEIEPRIATQYEIIQNIGHGGYDVIWKAVHKESKMIVIIKKMFDAFDYTIDPKRTYREIIYLQTLQGHENIVRLLNIIKAENNKDIYLIFDYMETDLHAVIRTGGLLEIHKKYILYQILKALKYIHSGGLVHLDLKPSKILLNSEYHTKLAGFDSVRSLTNSDYDTPPVLTEYVATRWYRAPEILLGSTNYTKAVDMWSVGCILGELVTGKTIFPGTSTLNQVERIIELLGKPNDSDIQSFESPITDQIIAILKISKLKSLQQYFQGASEDCLDLLRSLLQFNPSARLTASQALQHSYFKDIPLQGFEIEFTNPIKIQINDYRYFDYPEYRETNFSQISTRKNQKRIQWQVKLLQQALINSKNKSWEFKKNQKNSIQQHGKNKLYLVQSFQETQKKIEQKNTNSKQKLTQQKMQPQQKYIKNTLDCLQLVQNANQYGNGQKIIL